MSPKKKAPSSEGTAIPGLDLGSLEKLLGFMSQHGLEEFEYQHGDLQIRLRKSAAAQAGAAGPWIIPAPPVAPAVVTGQPVPNAAPASAPAVSDAARAAEPEKAAAREELHIVKSPIVGTFYASPSPGASPFVKVGDMVSSGQVMCIVEAMKLMNEIESDVNGEVARVLVEDGHPVEYGQGLFAVRAGNGKA